MMTFSLTSWLLGILGAARNKQMKIDQLDRAIEEKKRDIHELDRGIEAIQPMVDEAKKRADDTYYKLRSNVKKAERRKEKTELQLLEKFTHDFDRGWRR